MAFKELYSFTIDEEREVEKTHARKNKKTGEETTVTKKVKEQIPVQVRIKRPSRRELEEAELEYSVEMSRCVKRGILTKAMLYKKYSDTGGVWSEEDAKDYGKLYKEILDIQIFDVLETQILLTCCTTQESDDAYEFHNDIYD